MSIWGQAVPAGTVPTVESPPSTRGREVMNGNRARRAVNGTRDRDTASCGREIGRYVRFPAIASHTAIQRADKIQVHNQDDRAFAWIEGCGP